MNRIKVVLWAVAVLIIIYCYENLYAIAFEEWLVMAAAFASIWNVIYQTSPSHVCALIRKEDQHDWD